MDISLNENQIQNESFISKTHKKDISTDLSLDENLSLADSSFTVVRHRLDSRGRHIVKGKKQHKVTFCDYLGKSPLVEEILIESFKKENFVKKKSDRITCNVKCHIF